MILEAFMTHPAKADVAEHGEKAVFQGTLNGGGRSSGESEISPHL